MIRKDPSVLQTLRDIRRAEFAVTLARGYSREESAEALRFRAAAQGLSLHAAALAVLATRPTDDLLTDRADPPVPADERRHLYVLPLEAAAGESPVPATRRGRHRRR